MGQSIAEFPPQLQSAIMGLMAVCDVTITSGYRSEEEQARLYAGYIQGKPGFNMAAKPGTSHHENTSIGAVDLGGNLDCAHSHASQFGLHFPIKGEPWHVELIDPKAVSTMDYPTEEERRMFDIEQILMGGNNHLQSPIFTMDAEEANKAWQDGKPEETLSAAVDPADESFTNMASIAEAHGTAGQPTKGFGGAKQFNAPAATGPGAAQGSGGALSPVQAASYLAAAGFRGENLVLAVAIAMGESGLRANAHGDTSIAGGGWGHSIGLMQIRSRTGAAGSGDPRDPTMLEDPAFNARAAFQISGGGQNFKPWTVYTKGLYQRNMDTARQAVASLGNLGGPETAQEPAGATQQASLDLTGNRLIRPKPRLLGKRFR